jgi:branched-subunit amino acid transport protein
MHLKISNRKLSGIILAVVIIQGILLLISIPGQPCHIDEVWMGEQAYHEAQDGVARQELLTGMFGFEERMLIRHKLHIFLGDLSIRLFGFHLLGLRMVSILSGVALVWMMFRCVQRQEHKNGTEFLIAISILFSTPLMFRYMKIYRPEFLLTALGFASFLFVSRSLEQKSIPPAVLASVFAGLAALAHLNGIIFIVAGTGVFLLEKRWKAAAVFLSLSLGIAALYFYDISGNYALFREQFFNDFVVERRDYGVWAPLMRLLNEHERYFRTPEIIGISVLFVLALPLAFGRMMKENRILFRYLFFLFLALALFTKSITTKYAIPLLPFMAMGIASLFSLWLRKESGVNRVVGTILALFIMVHTGYGLYYGEKNALTEKSSLVKNNAKFGASMERGSRVLAPGRFIYNEIGRFEIRDIHAARYLIMNEQKKDFTLSSLCEYALANRFDYILLDREYRKFGNIDPQKVFPPVWGYAVKKEYADGTLLMKKFELDKTRSSR